MIRRTASGAAALLLLALAGCSAGSSPSASPAATPEPVGGLGVAVSALCEAGSDPQCVPVGGQDVLVDPEDFTRAGVAAVEADPSTGVVDVRFDEAGAALLRRGSQAAIDEGADARLLLRVGDRVESALSVMQPIEGDTVQIVPAEGDAQGLVDRILAG
ncbi:hypothetical protein [Rathayibacter sp. AY1F6]|uniref:hypothetical protein n=1 Tax=Rathayibacter sp. AY1F6 TaxID=2080560 RepID=UPI000CE7D115|nr:hypothetical protein [Rathayibacter sp. AY1F6]